MPWTSLRLITILVSLGLLIPACSRKAQAPAKIEPASIEYVDDTGLHRLTLTDRAVERLDIQTAAVAETGGRLSAPYSAVIYGLNGETWAYTNPEGNLYVRAPITVDAIEGDTAYLTEGPEIGTAVVTVGAAELLGTEFGIGK